LDLRFFRIEATRGLHGYLRKIVLDCRAGSGDYPAPLKIHLSPPRKGDSQKINRMVASLNLPQAARSPAFAENV